VRGAFFLPQNAPEPVWWPGSAPIRWGSLWLRSFSNLDRSRSIRAPEWLDGSISYL